MYKKITTPILDRDIKDLKVADMIYLSGKIYCGRDSVLPKICDMIDNKKLGDIVLEGAVIFHTAVSPAGIGPTSSNKEEIEGSIPKLSEAGVKLHLGKGAIGSETIKELDRCNSVYAVIPPITALLKDNTISQKVVVFPELGMEAFYELEVKEFPCIIAAAHNESIY